MKKETDYTVTIVYKAILEKTIKAASPQEAEKKSKELFEKNGFVKLNKAANYGVCVLNDSTYEIAGCLNIKKANIYE